MSDDIVNKGYHCAWQIHYHMVFPVKYRKALLDGEVIKILKEITYCIGQRYAIEMEAIDSDKDHIHILYGVHPKLISNSIQIK